MSQNKDDKSASSRPANEAGLPKRPVPTIDLKATEIKSDPKPAAPSGAAPAAPKASDSAGAASTTPGKVESKPPVAGASGTVVPNIEPKSGGKSPLDEKKVGETSKPQTNLGGKPGAPGGTSSPSSSTASAAAVKPAPSTPTAAKSGSGIGRALSYMSAAILGGLLAIFAADFLANSLGVDIRPGAPPSTTVEDLTTRLAKLENSATQAPAGQQGLTEQLKQANERIGKLEGANRQLSALSEAQTQLVATTRALEEKVGQGAVSGATPEAAGRIAKLEETIQGLTAVAQAQPGRPIPEFARLTTKLSELDAAVAALRKTGGNEATAQVDARLAEARKAEAQLTEAMNQIKAESTKRLRELEAVKSQAERLEQKVDGIKADAGSARSNVDALKSDVTAQLQTVARQGDLKTTVDVVDKRVAGLESKLDVMSKRDEERQANAERIVVSLQLANLKRAMDQGKPFGEALSEVEKAAGNVVDVAPLRAFRDKGVPNATELTGQFRQVARNVLEAEQDKAQATTMDRLLQSAKSVVQIRRVGGDIKGDTAEAVLARAENSLKSGDLDAAAKEMKTLKPELRLAAQTWLDQLDARVTVDRALKAIEDKLKTSIAGAPAGGKGGK